MKQYYLWAIGLCRYINATPIVIHTRFKWHETHLRYEQKFWLICAYLILIVKATGFRMKLSKLLMKATYLNRVDPRKHSWDTMICDMSTSQEPITASHTLPCAISSLCVIPSSSYLTNMYVSMAQKLLTNQPIRFHGSLTPSLPYYLFRVLKSFCFAATHL